MIGPISIGITTHARRRDHRSLPHAVLGSAPGRFVERYAGDACSALGVVAAGSLLLSRKWLPFENPGERLAVGSMLAASVDTGIQGYNTLSDGGKAAARRGNNRSNWRSTLYGSTGLIPAAGISAVAGLRRHPSINERAVAGALVLNGAAMGYELIHRLPRMRDGRENLSGYGSFLAAAGGFVVSKHMVP